MSGIEFPTQGFFVFCKWWFVDVSSLCRPFSYLSSSSSSSSSFLFFLIVFLLLVSRISLFSLFEKNFFFSGEAKVSRIDTQSQKAPELAFPIPRKFLYFILLSHTFSFFHFSFSRKKKLRVCGAEAERTLQKGGGDFEFAIKIIAYHSLSLSFSPLKSIIFTKSRHFVIFDSVDGQFMDWPNPSWDFVTIETVHHRYQAVTSCRTWQVWTTDVVHPTLCPTLCQLFAGCSCAPAHTQHPPAAGHISCGSHATHTIHSHVSSAHNRICSTLTLCPRAQPLLQRNSLCRFTSLLPMRSNPLATNPVSLRSWYHATIMTFLCSQWRTLKAQAFLSFALPPFAHMRITIAFHAHCLLTHSLLCAMSRAAIASRIAFAELCQSASAHRFFVVLHAHIYCFAFRELLLLLVAQPELHLTALLLSLSDVRVRGRCYFFWRSRRATFVRAQNCVATSCCR